MSMFTPAGTGGGRARRGGGAVRRVLAVTVVLLVMAGVVAIAWNRALQQPDEKVTSQPSVSCPAPQPTLVVLPPDRVKVNVYNDTRRNGLAASAAKTLRKRDFRIGEIANDPLERTVKGVAEVRHGPTGKDAARTVAVHVGDVGDGLALVAVKRKGRAVDLVLGPGFTALRPATVAAGAVSPSPEALPSGCPGSAGSAEDS
jgi:hypothetical protein